MMDSHIGETDSCNVVGVGAVVVATCIVFVALFHCWLVLWSFLDAFSRCRLLLFLLILFLFITPSRYIFVFLLAVDRSAPRR